MKRPRFEALRLTSAWNDFNYEKAKMVQGTNHETGEQQWFAEIGEMTLGDKRTIRSLIKWLEKAEKWTGKKIDGAE